MKTQGSFFKNDEEFQDSWQEGIKLSMEPF